MRFLLSFSILCVLFSNISCSKSDSNDSNIINGNDTVGHNIKLWGVSLNGGSYNKGTIFTINGDGTSYTTIHSFDSITGSYPDGSLCKAANGKLYGFTVNGGSEDVGTIFSINPIGNIFTKIKEYSISNLNEVLPGGAFTVASDGKLYSVVGNTIMRLDPSNDNVQSLYTLTNTTGVHVVGKLLQATDGKLYGLASGSGAYDSGTIFKYDITNNIVTKLHDFNGINGSTPYHSLIQASDGNLYGLTVKGGTNGTGVAFKYNPTSNVFTKLCDLNTPNGATPFSSFVQLGQKLFASTFHGGAADLGTIISWDIIQSLPKNEIEFNILTNKSTGPGEILLASNGLIYGFIVATGSAGAGLSVYRYNPANNDYKVVYTFQSNEAQTDVHNSLIQF